SAGAAAPCRAPHPAPPPPPPPPPPLPGGFCFFGGGGITPPGEDQVMPPRPRPRVHTPPPARAPPRGAPPPPAAPPPDPGVRGEGQRVFLDAEHFFDGYRSDPGYALEVVRTAVEAGADLVALCDTNGGMLPTEIGDVVAAVAATTGARLGIHCHDDTACAVANTLTAVSAGASHVQGTANGYGERAGNANLFSVVAGLQLKQGRQVLPEGCLPEMSRVAHAISEVTNVTPVTHQPYVGHSAFAHKAGLHASAVKVDPMLYQHIDPAVVGNDMR